MIRRFIITTIIGLCVSITTDAQTFTQRLATPAKNGAKVTVNHDKAIDELVNGDRQAATAAPAKKPVVTEKPKIAADTKQTVATNVEKKQTDTTVAATTHVTAVDTTAAAKKTTHSIKTTGYRVQVFAGGNSRKDRQTAERIGNELRVLFPSESVYVHFYSPRWICRMGNFRTQEEAHRALQEVKKLGYNAATIVKGKITIQY